MDILENYKLKYNFGNYNSRVVDMLNEILSGSNNLFAKQLKNGQIGNVKREYVKMLSFIKNVEEYLYYYSRNENFDTILNSISNIKKISVLPIDKRGIYGQAIPEEKTLLINPSLRASTTLNHEERTRLYVAHELGHFINNNWMDTVIKYLDIRVRQGEVSNEQAQLFQEGFSMLDECITQNNAENFAYEFAGKNRPSKQYVTRNVGVFGNKPYQTNFDFYGEFQIPAAKFAKTLRGIGKYENDDVALNILSQRALNPNFAIDIIEEYERDNQYSNLQKLVRKMGVIKKAVYTSFGCDNNMQALRNSENALNEFYNLANKMRDYRNNEFDTINNSNLENQNISRLTPRNINRLTQNCVKNKPGKLSQILRKLPRGIVKIVNNIKNKIAGNVDRNNDR